MHRTVVEQLVPQMRALILRMSLLGIHCCGFVHAIVSEAMYGAHLFGAEDAMRNRKVVGILVRAVGLGKFGDNNGWPIAMARRRFKCCKEEGGGRRVLLDVSGLSLNRPRYLAIDIQPG